jgi:hypothetical protein
MLVTAGCARGAWKVTVQTLCVLVVSAAGACNRGEPGTRAPAGDSGTTTSPEVGATDVGPDAQGSSMSDAPASVEAGSLTPDGGGADGDPAGVDGLPAWGAYPGASIEKLAADTAKRILVAPDERHVAFSRLAEPAALEGCGGAGDLSLAALTVQGPRIMPLAMGDAGFGELRFAGGGTHVVFIGGICSTSPRLELADTETGMVRSLAAGSLFPRLDVQGKAVAWVAQTGFATAAVKRVGAVRLDGVAVPEFPRPSGANFLSLDPTGTSIYYDDVAGRHVRTVSGNAPVPITLLQAWSPDGTTLAAREGESLVVRSIDGANPRTLATDCPCTNVSYSPDGKRLIYDVLSQPARSGQVRVRAIDGTGEVVLAPPAGGDVSGFLKRYWSPGGRWHVLWGDRTDRLLIGDTSRSGDLLVTNVNGARVSLAANDEFLAYDVAGGAVWLAPLPFTQPSTIESTNAGLLAFQPLPGSARVAVMINRERTTYVTDVGIFDARAPAKPVAVARDVQGTLRTGFENIRDPFWAGHLLIFAFNARKTAATGESIFDLGALKDDGSAAGTLATDVVQYAWRGDGVAPRRLFFARSRASGGGLWTVTIPE